MLHHFHGNGHEPSPGSFSAEQLEQLIDKCPNHVYVFDDGLKCQIDVALPVLNKKGIKGTFCVITGHLEDKAPRLEVYRWFMCTFPSRDNFYEAFYDFSGCKPGPITGEWPAFYTDADKGYKACRDALPRKTFEYYMDRLMRHHGNDPEHVGKRVYMSEQDIKALSDTGHFVGLHSHTHPFRMASLTAREQREEYQTNSDIITAITGIRPFVMSYPSNSVSALSKVILADIGIVKGYRADHINGGTMELPRIDHRLLGQKLGICE